MANAREILHIILDAGHDDSEDAQYERRSVERALKILQNAPSSHLYDNIKKLAATLSGDHQVFFSEDGKTALIMDEKDGNTLMVKLTREKYATAAAKLFWAEADLTGVAQP
jgi:hypothetical protein